MYAQMVETGAARLRAAGELSEEEHAFQARIDAGVKIEPKDWMAKLMGCLGAKVVGDPTFWKGAEAAQ